MSTLPFNHQMAAHCETGTIGAILNHKGMAITEPMVFGIAGGIFFAYLDIREFTFPQFVMRNKPGEIRKNISKRLGIKFESSRFRSPLRAQGSLDSLIEKGIPTAVQVDMFYMDYIPKYMKVHFNGHFITVVGKEESQYIVSDCYYPSLIKLPAESLIKGRFAKGNLAPGGFQFYPVKVPEQPDWTRAISSGIKQACFYMTKIPIPFLGVKGIRKFGQSILKWPNLTNNIEHLSHEIMMIHVTLEERGTGGGGFRFMYASFLQEASKILNNSSLSDFSKRMMENGDKWREISLFVARIGKNRDLGQNRLNELQQMLMERADVEESFFKELGKSI